MSQKLTLLSFLAVFGILRIVNANIIKVPEQYDEISEAIYNANNGDTVSVLPGTAGDPEVYAEALEFGSKNILIAARNSPTASPREIDNPDPEATIIDANTLDTNVVRIAGGQTQAELRGFTLKNGQADEGGGIFIQASPVIQKVIVEDNSASKGAGIFIKVDHPVIRNVTIRDNSSSSHGGGITSLCNCKC